MIQFALALIPYLLSGSEASARPQVQRYSLQSLADSNPAFHYQHSTEDLFCLSPNDGEYGLLFKEGATKLQPQLIQLMRRPSDSNRWEEVETLSVTESWNSNDSIVKYNPSLVELEPRQMYFAGQKLIEFKREKAFELEWSRQGLGPEYEAFHFGSQTGYRQLAKVKLTLNKSQEAWINLIGSLVKKRTHKIERQSLDFTCYYELHLVNNETGQRTPIYMR